LVAGFVCVFVCGFAPAPSKPSVAEAPPAQTEAAPVKSSAPYPIDNFEDPDMVKSPEWFSFDNVVLKVEKTSKLYKGEKAVIASTGNYALSASGSTTRWYVGGMGTMLGIDASKYSGVEMDVYGNGEGSGRIKVELYEDDNGNKEIEVDNKWTPTVDDQWSYEINVFWSGWKHLAIPFPSFALANAGKGNGKFDPDQKNGSAGLVKMQLIFVANGEKGDINFSVDNIELSK